MREKQLLFHNLTAPPKNKNKKIIIIICRTQGSKPKALSRALSEERQRHSLVTLSVLQLKWRAACTLYAQSHTT